jgi:hypothetical protein
MVAGTILMLAFAAKDVSFFEALSVWSTGRSTDTLVLFGLSMVWWGRIGKILQVIGGVLVVSEIIGEERIKEYGESLHRKTSSSVLRDIFRRINQARDGSFIAQLVVLIPFTFVTVVVFSVAVASLFGGGRATLAVVLLVSFILLLGVCLLVGWYYADNPEALPFESPVRVDDEVPSEDYPEPSDPYGWSFSPLEPSQEEADDLEYPDYYTGMPSLEISPTEGITAVLFTALYGFFLLPWALVTWLGWIFDKVLIRPSAWILEKNIRSFKIASVLFLLIGSFLDVLST